MVPRRRAANTAPSATPSANHEQQTTVKSARKPGGQKDSSESRAARDILSVNSTLNAFIGGPTRSWMSGERTLSMPEGSGGSTSSGPTRMRKTFGASRHPSQPEQGKRSPPPEISVVSVISQESITQRTGLDRKDSPSNGPGNASDNASIGVDGRSILPSPAPSKSPPGPEYRELEARRNNIVSECNEASGVSPVQQGEMSALAISSPVIEHIQLSTTPGSSPYQFPKLPMFSVSQAGRKRTTEEVGDTRSPKRMVTGLPTTSPERIVRVQETYSPKPLTMNSPPSTVRFDQRQSHFQQDAIQYSSDRRSNRQHAQSSVSRPMVSPSFNNPPRIQAQPTSLSGTSTHQHTGPHFNECLKPSQPPNPVSMPTNSPTQYVPIDVANGRRSVYASLNSPGISPMQANFDSNADLRTQHSPHTLHNSPRTQPQQSQPQRQTQHHQRQSSNYAPHNHPLPNHQPQNHQQQNYQQQNYQQQNYQQQNYQQQNHQQQNPQSHNQPNLQHQHQQPQRQHHHHPHQLPHRQSGTQPQQMVPQQRFISQSQSQAQGNPIQFLISKLDNFRSQAEQDQVPLGPLEMMRLNALLEAIQEDDLLYLLIHQLYSAQTLSSDSLQKLGGFTADHVDGLNALRPYLDDNMKLPLRSLRFFAGFPWEFGCAQMQYHRIVLAGLEEAKEFLKNSAKMLNILGGYCRKHQKKISKEEVTKVMGLRSSVLSKIISICLQKFVRRLMQTQSPQQIPPQHPPPPPIPNGGAQNSNLTQLSGGGSGYSDGIHMPAPSQPVMQSPNFQQYIQQLQQLKNIQKKNNPSVTAAGILSQPPPPTPTHPHAVSSVAPATAYPTQQLTPTAPAGWTANMQTLPNDNGRHVHKAHLQSQLGASNIANRRQSQPLPVAQSVPRRPAPPPDLSTSPSVLRPDNRPPTIGSLPENILETHLASPLMSPTTSKVKHESMHISIVDFPIRRLPLSFKCEKRVWDLSQKQASRLSKTIVSIVPGDLPKRQMVTPGALIFRLRCVAIRPGSTGPINDAQWVSKETVWPKNVFIEVNGSRVEIRRKLLWGKDLPSDITNYLQAGTNELKIVNISDSTDHKVYMASVEMFECHSEEAIKSRLFKEGYLDSIKSRDAILQRLLPKCDDDELMISSSTVTIGVCCPLSFQLINIPVRGKSCLHLECFDFENFMSSRPRKRPGEPPSPDSYKCPHCGGDSRPDELIFDGFLSEILAELRKKQAELGDVKSIVVDDHGNWSAKKEKDSDQSDREDCQSLQSKSRPSLGNPSTESRRTDVEVICINDDDED